MSIQFLNNTQVSFISIASGSRDEDDLRIKTYLALVGEGAKYEWVEDGYEEYKVLVPGSAQWADLKNLVDEETYSLHQEGFFLNNDYLRKEDNEKWIEHNREGLMKALSMLESHSDGGALASFLSDEEAKKAKKEAFLASYPTFVPPTQEDYEVEFSKELHFNRSEWVLIQYTPASKKWGMTGGGSYSSSDGMRRGQTKGQLGEILVSHKWEFMTEDGLEDYITRPYEWQGEAPTSPELKQIPTYEEWVAEKQKDYLSIRYSALYKHMS